jgi:hypothetical protein
MYKLLNLHFFCKSLFCYNIWIRIQKYNNVQKYHVTEVKTSIQVRKFGLVQSTIPTFLTRMLRRILALG